MTDHSPTALDRRIVRGLASEGIGHHRIAAIVQVSVATLRRCYRDELAAGVSRAGLVAFLETPPPTLADVPELLPIEIPPITWDS